MTTLLRTAHSPLRTVVPVLIALAAMLVYANALQNGFALDDEGIVLRNNLVHQLDGVWRAFANPYWPNGGGQYRPLVIASFTIEWSLWGPHPAGYHAVNLVLHAVASVLVYFLARRWLSFGGSAIAATLFAVHPVHVEAVANVVGRAELLAACGVLGALLLHVRRSAWAPVVFALALLSKEHALVTPALALLADLAGRNGIVRGEGERASRVWPLYAAYGTIAVVWAIVVAWTFRGPSFAIVDVLWQTIDAPTRWLTMLGVVVSWVRLWFFPFELSADYSPRVTLVWPENGGSVAMGAAILIGALILCVGSWRKSRSVAVALAWLAVATLPIANLVVPTGVILAERTLYLSSVGAVLLLGTVAEAFARRQTVVVLSGAAVLAVAFAVRTWTRTPIWASNRSLVLTTLADQPNASWTHILMGRVYDGNGAYEKALAEYRTAIALFDVSPIAWASAIESSARLGDIPRTESLIEQGRTRTGGHYLVSAAHAAAALRGNRFAEALRAARHANSTEPDSARAHFYAAQALAGLGFPDSARAELDRIPAGQTLGGAVDSLRARLKPQGP